MSPYHFTAPKSLAEAEDRKLAVTHNVQNIEGQLADRNRTMPGGARLDTRAYHAWRAKSVTALKFQHAELRALNKWIKDTRLAVVCSAAGVTDPSPEKLLVAASKVFEALRRDVDLDAEELAVADAVREYLRHRA